MESFHPLLAETKYLADYSRWDSDAKKMETWDESVDRAMEMHERKLGTHLEQPKLRQYFEDARQAYKERQVLGAQRALQFGGDQLLKHEAKMYNCSSSYVDRPAFFAEAAYLLLCGCGVGFSVQKQHIAKLPTIARPSRTDTVLHYVEDSIEGWADTVAATMSMYFTAGTKFPEYFGKNVVFDYSRVRKAGSFISGGFRAPGPEPLANSINKIRELLDAATTETGTTVIKPITAYDIVMYIAQFVLSGGVRRSATLCMFSLDDDEMMNAKTGTWYMPDQNPQRAYSNNSVMLLRGSVTKEQWDSIKESVREFGEPGFIWTDSLENLYNPCVEIGMRGYTQHMVSGFQFCNLVEICGAIIKTREEFMEAVKNATVLATIQAAYTKLKYVSQSTIDITEREALIGVSITGWMSNSEFLLDAEMLEAGAEYCKRVNREVAAMIGINPAARTTCVKPSGNASTLLSDKVVCTSGIHLDHANNYFRTMRLPSDSDIVKLYRKMNPKMVEPSVSTMEPNVSVIYFPLKAKEGAQLKKDYSGVDLLKVVKFVQKHWVNAGTDKELSVDPTLRHNVSNTINYTDLDQTMDYIYTHREDYCGVSLLSAFGDKAYAQSPFCEVLMADELLEKYGHHSLYASALITDGIAAFGDLWSATGTAMQYNYSNYDQFIDPDSEEAKQVNENAVKLMEEIVVSSMGDDHSTLLKRDWIRRFHKFARRFNGDTQKTVELLKDVHNNFRWDEIVRSYKPMDLVSVIQEPEYEDAGKHTATACAGGVCDLVI